MQTGDPELDKALATLRAQYREVLPVRVTQLEDCWGAACGVAWSKDALFPAFRAAHSLSGTAATYGYEEVGERARRLAHRLDEIIRQEEAATAARQAELDDLVAGVREAADRAL